jgi:hypothetical protein
VTLAHDTTVITQGLLLPIYDVRRPLFNGLLSSYLDQIQQLEDAAWSVYIGTMLPSATGDALDMLGALVGQPRGGRDDATYKLWITARVRLASSSGTPVDLLAIVRAVLPLTITITLIEYFPADVAIDMAGAIDAQTALQIGEMLQQAKAAGVRIDLISSPSAAGENFSFGSAASTPDIDVNRGFADAAQTTGGKLTGVYS